MHIFFHQTIQAVAQSFTCDLADSEGHLKQLINTHGPLKVYNAKSSGWVDWSDDLLAEEVQEIIVLKWRCVSTVLALLFTCFQ